MRSWSAGVAVVAVLGVGLPDPHARAASGLAAPSATPLERAEAHMEAGQFRAAGDAFGEYYAALPPAMQRDATGEYVVMMAAEAYAKAWDEDHEVASLEKSKALLAGFVTPLAAADAASPLLARPQAELARIEGLLAEARTPEPEPEPEPEPAETSEPDPEPEPERDPEPEPEPTATKIGPTDDEPDTAGRDPKAIALLAAGSALVAGGVTMIIVGPVQHARFDGQIDDRLDMLQDGQTLDPDALSQSKQTVDTMRNALIGAGAAAAAIGVAGIVWGAVRLKRQRTSPNRAQIGLNPRLSRSSLGLALSGRF